MATKGKGKGKAKAAVVPTQDQIKARATEIMEEAGVGFVKAAIYARREFGLVPKNLGKVRLGKKAAAKAAAAAAATA